MSVMEHITKWRAASLALPERNPLVILGLLLAIILIPLIKFPKTESITESTARLGYQVAGACKVFDPLLIAFSDGILNPTIYEPAHI